MTELWKNVEKNKLPDLAIVDKDNKIIKGYDYLLDYDSVARGYENLESIIRELESIGVRMLDPKELPSFDEIFGREKLKALFKAAVEMTGVRASKEIKSNYRTMLLYGPPGTGKTRFVMAAIKELAKKYGEDKVVPLSVESIKSSWYGETGRRINTLAEKVEQLAKQGKIPVVVIDEADRLALNRALARGGGDHDAVNNLLPAINRMKEAGAYIFAMTNNPDMLDPAVKDRFGVLEYVPQPDKNELAQYIKANVQEPDFINRINVDDLAKSMAENKLSFREASKLIGYALWQYKEGKSPSEAVKEALNFIIESRKYSDQNFLNRDNT